MNKFKEYLERNLIPITDKITNNSKVDNVEGLKGILR